MKKQNKFASERKKITRNLAKDKKLKRASSEFLEISAIKKYPYLFDWMGVPIIQYPQDIVVMQELLWQIKPDLVIETGIARGGSLIFYASILELIGKGSVVGVDIDIRKHTRDAVKGHKLGKRIKMIQGSSTDPKVITQVKRLAKGKKKVLVCFDSMHTGDHVEKELELYSPLVTKNSYLVVFDTVLDNLPNRAMNHRPWTKKNNPMTAVKKFLKTNKNFKIDKELESKLLITVAPNGFLKRVK